MASGSASSNRPPRVPFTLQAGEQVLLVARRHWAYLMWQMEKLAVFALVPAVALLVVAALTYGLGGRGGQITWLIVAAWLLAWAVRAYFTWYRYNNDVWVVTDQRVVDSSRNHWFHHRMASADLDDVEDIAVRTDGIFPTVFKFGDVRLQTAGQEANFVLSGIPGPKDVLALIDRQRDVAKRRLRGLL